MEYLPWILLGICAVIITALSLKVCSLRRSAREILTSFSERLSEDTNNLISISSRDKKMRELAEGISGQLRLLRKQKLLYKQCDNEIKEAITNISHDLRTPLTALCGYLELLEKEELSPQAERCTKMIRNRTEALKKLTEELFRYSVIVSSDSDIKETVCLNAVLEDSLASFYALFKERGIEPDISVTDTKLMQTLSKNALSRVFENIISNAIKYSGGDFFVSADENGKIVFSNSAPSLTSVTAGRLFDRFYTVETGTNSTGLGLSIAKLLTERMGGKIDSVYTEGKLILTLNFPANK